MTDIARYDPHQTGSGHLLHAVNGQFQLSFDNLVDFFLRVEVFVDAGTAFEIVVCERHIG